ERHELVLAVDQAALEIHGTSLQRLRRTAHGRDRARPITGDYAASGHCVPSSALAASSSAMAASQRAVSSSSLSEAAWYSDNKRLRRAASSYTVGSASSADRVFCSASSAEIRSSSWATVFSSGPSLTLRFWRASASRRLRALSSSRDFCAA